MKLSDQELETIGEFEKVGKAIINGPWEDDEIVSSIRVLEAMTAFLEGWNADRSLLFRLQDKKNDFWAMVRARKLEIEVQKPKEHSFFVQEHKQIIDDKTAEEFKKVGMLMLGWNWKDSDLLLSLKILNPVIAFLHGWGEDGSILFRLELIREDFSFYARGRKLKI